MEIIKIYHHNSLIDFYISSGLEFVTDKKYYYTPIFSYVAKIDNEFVGAIMIYINNS